MNEPTDLPEGFELELVPLHSDEARKEHTVVQDDLEEPRAEDEPAEIYAEKEVLG